MGVYWAKQAAIDFAGQVEIIDLRTIHPIDFETIQASVQKHGRCLVLTEEPINNSFAQALAGRISSTCFEYLDAAVAVLGSESLPAIPLNAQLEFTMMPNAAKVTTIIQNILAY